MPSPPHINALLYVLRACERLVAQVSNLLYRGFPICEDCEVSGRAGEWNSAIQQIGNLRYAWRHILAHGGLTVVALIGLCCVSLSEAAPVKVALLTGDAQSSAAVAAVNELRRDPALADVTVRVFPRVELSDADRRFVREGDIIIGYTRYGALLRALESELRAAAARGATLAPRLGRQTSRDQ